MQMSLHKQGVLFAPFLMGNMQNCLFTLLKNWWIAISPETLNVFIGVMYIL